MTWILIGVVLLVAFGPVLWLVPSRRDRRLAALRARARTEGLVVELRRLPKPDPSPQERVSAGGRVREPVIECAAYGYAQQRKLSLLPGWRVVRAPADQKPDPFPGWRYDQRPRGDGRRYLAQMLPPSQRLLEALPEDVAGFEISDRMLLVYWLEKPGSNEATVSALAGQLREFEARLRDLEDEIQAAMDHNDS